MCMGMNNYRGKSEAAVKPKSLIRKDPIEELTEHICDNLCKYPVSDITQDELDEKCQSCILNRIEGLILSERID